MDSTVQGCLKTLESGLCELSLLNQKNQETLKSPSQQLFLLNESIISNAFRRFENFIENSFLLYLMENKTITGNPVKSFLRPKDLDHAYEMIKSTQIYIKWNDANTMRKMSEIYLDDDGFPLKIPIITNLQTIDEIRIVRNHIAHNSRESERSYKNVIIKYYGTMPSNIPGPGELLQKIVESGTQKKMLLSIYLEKIWDVACAISESP